MLVAVVGAGMAGLVALKNCLEEGHDVVGFEREDSVGGLWKRKDEQNVTTCMDDTKTNFSKHRMAFTDFVFPDDTPLFPGAKEMEIFFQTYAEHFHILQYIKFKSTIKSIDFDTPGPDGERFAIVYEHESKEARMVVDRVVAATGLNTLTNIPNINGIENFRGEILHSRSFRSGRPYENKRCLVVGSRSSASDICAALVKSKAKAIYMSHRAGVAIIPRIWRGQPFDYLLTRRLAIMQSTAENMKTYLSGTVTNLLIRFVQWSSFSIKKEWNMTPVPDIRASVPCISDTLVPFLESGQVVPVMGISLIESDGTVVLADGTKLEGIEAIFFATGYRSDLAASLPLSTAILDRIRYNPAQPHRFPMYKYALTAHLPEFAILNQAFALIGAPVGFDIRSLWLTSIWSGKIKLPSEEELLKESKREDAYLDGLAKFGYVTPGTMPIENIFAIAREAGFADDHTKWFKGASLKGWLWSLKNPRLSRMVMDGPDLPCSFRLRGPRKWRGAEETIRKTDTIQKYTLSY